MVHATKNYGINKYNNKQSGLKVSYYIYLYFLLLLSPQCEHPVLATEHVGHPICGSMTATDFPPENNENKCNGLSLFTKSIKYYASQSFV